MAITTNTFKVNAGWGKSDVITQMEQAMTYLGWQGGEISGYIVGIGTIWGGGDTNAADIYESVSQKSTSGVGTNATFYIYRDTNTVRYVLPMMPGEGYASGDIVTIDADDIGGFSNGATDLSFRVCVDEIVTNGATLSVAMTSVTYTGVLGEGRIYWEGTDRNGVVSPGSTTFTIREGDTISIGNSYSASWSPSICLNNYWQRVDADGPEDGVISGQNIYLGLNESYNFTPKLGQRGEYIFRSSDAAYFAEAGRIIIEPWQGDPGDRTTVGFGTTSSFWQKNLDGGVNGPWAVQKHVINPNKRYGTTYRGFEAHDNGYIDVLTFSGYHHYDGTEYYVSGGVDNHDALPHYHGGTGYASRIAGASQLDFPDYNIGSANSNVLSFPDQSYTTSDYIEMYRLSHGTNYGFDLDLNVFRSTIDPRFAVFSYRAPTLSSAHLTDNTFDTFFFHNFETTVWDLDYVFLGGMTTINPTASGNTTAPGLKITTYTHTEGSGRAASKRTAEFPYAEYSSYGATNDHQIEQYIYSQTVTTNIDRDLRTSRVYYRSNDQMTKIYGGYPYQGVGNQRVAPEANFNAVIKGIPMNAHLIPCPYYIPEDFGIVEFFYNAANANIQQGDTFTISPSEVWTVITASYNQDTTTKGIAFCARTV